MSTTRAVSLYSGGLDSILAAKIIIAQGIEVTALQFITPFFGYEKKDREKEEEEDVFNKYKIKLKIIEIGQEYIEMLKNPPHGYGRNFNPCIDCKIMLVNEARKYMQQNGASFLITGEVIGQRPMSQRKDAMRIVERDSGCDGILLRPLCAKNLKPTWPEEEEIVDREKLFDFRGRTRKPQMSLAEKMGIIDYPSPAGGCMLTDPTLGERIKKRFSENSNIKVNDILLLKLGRHFKLKKDSHLVVGRFHQENQEIIKLKQDGDILFKVIDFPGPIALLRGLDLDEATVDITASVAARYSDGKGESSVRVGLGNDPGRLVDLRLVKPIKEDILERFRY